MDHTLRVRAVEGLGNLLRKLHCRVQRQFAVCLRQDLAQGLSRDVLHHQIWFVSVGIFCCVEDGYNSGVREPPGCPRFLRKAFTVLSLVACILAGKGNGLDCDIAVDLGVKRSIHHSHGTAADFGLDLIPAQRLQDGSSHR